MPGAAQPSELRTLQEEIESFIRAQPHPVVAEDETIQFDLTAAAWRVTVEFDKLLFEVWNTDRSIARRVEEIDYRDRGRLGLFVRKSAGKASSTLEIRDLGIPSRPATREARSSYQSQLAAMLGRQFPGWKLERVSHRTDREHTFSGLYTRGVARRGTSGWAFLGLSPEEAPGAADALLAHAVIWLDWLRSHGGPAPSPIDLRDFGNVAARLAPRRQGEELLERHAPLVSSLLGDYLNHVDIIPTSAANALSLRVQGLEVARIEGLLAPRVFFGLEESVRRFKPENQREFIEFLSSVLEYRRPGSHDKGHEFFRLQSERWLEALLVRDITRVDPALRQEFVYPQVPAFTGQDRGVIDILSVSASGRLAVIELKLDEDINLPFQGLDYWLRVHWLQQSGGFHKSGYFPGVQISDEPPLIYLVSPAFRFHSTSDRLIRYVSPSIEIIKVGMNQQWRSKVDILFRRDARES